MPAGSQSGCAHVPEHALSLVNGSSSPRARGPVVPPEPRLRNGGASPYTSTDDGRTAPTPRSGGHVRARPVEPAIWKDQLVLLHLNPNVPAGCDAKSSNLIQ